MVPDAGVDGEPAMVYVNVVVPVTVIVFSPLYPAGLAPLNITFCPSSKPCFFGVVTVAVVDVRAILVTGNCNF